MNSHDIFHKNAFIFVTKNRKFIKISMNSVCDAYKIKNFKECSIQNATIFETLDYATNVFDKLKYSPSDFINLNPKIVKIKLFLDEQDLFKTLLTL